MAMEEEYLRVEDRIVIRMNEEYLKMVGKNDDTFSRKRRNKYHVKFDRDSHLSGL